MKQPNIAFIGGGNMAASIIGGLVENGFPAVNIRVADPFEAGRTKLEADFGVTTSADNSDICVDADVIVFAVKPQILKSVAEGIAGVIPAGAVIVSIAAGIPVSALQQWLGENRAIVRCMPNTPALVHQGASGLYATSQVSGEQRTQVEGIFTAVGIVTWLAGESELDAVTALSGSGPAYFFLMIDAMEQAGISLGLEPKTAKQLSLQTALGAATMAANSDVDCAELRRRVTSPGGTTEKAIATFTDGGLPALVSEAMQSAHRRSIEMAEEFSK